ncbi:MAG: UDP-N-acetylmuramoyl-L-alanyl-D-glutamate--2,6-diaminopimelate ligase [Pseudomonadota bacterium]
MSLTLADIIECLETPKVWGNVEACVEDITYDSRKVGHNFIFVAIRGEKTDGHNFVHKASESGASVIIAEENPPTNFDIDKTSWVRVIDSRRALGPVADLIYGHPSRQMVLIGITGTNGKTTTTFLLESILNEADFVPGIIGTISHRWRGFETPASNTTPEASDIQKMLADMKLAGVTHVLMEVSSHGLFLRRLDGCSFDLAIFTNLTHDHLDFHQNMASYFEAKRILFDELLPVSSKSTTCSIINLDDLYGSRLAQETIGLPSITYGFNELADIHPLSQEVSISGIRASIHTPNGVLSIKSELVGNFNLSNILSAVSASVILQIPTEAVVRGVESLKTVPGRLQPIESNVGSLFVDYAHTPNALKNVLQALRQISDGRLITLMGCGGDRDRTKRQVMGSEAAVVSDFLVITSDNPRTEDPLTIIEQIEIGVIESGFKKILPDSKHSCIAAKTYVVIPDRRQAIQWIIKRLQPRDTLLLAGKGHETYQEIQGVRYPFDDRSVALEIINGLKSGNPANTPSNAVTIELRA